MILRLLLLQLALVSSSKGRESNILRDRTVISTDEQCCQLFIVFIPKGADFFFWWKKRLMDTTDSKTFWLMSLYSFRHDISSIRTSTRSPGPVTYSGFRSLDSKLISPTWTKRPRRRGQPNKIEKLEKDLLERQRLKLSAQPQLCLTKKKSLHPINGWKYMDLEIL